MEKPTIHLIGHKLRWEFKAPENLPYPMQMALKALARRPVRNGDNDNDAQQDEFPREDVTPAALHCSDIGDQR
jgi:hypothetical protein